VRVLIFYNCPDLEKSLGSLLRSRDPGVELKARDELNACISALEQLNADGNGKGRDAHGENGNGGNGNGENGNGAQGRDGNGAQGRNGNEAAVDLLYLDISGMPAAQRTRSLRRLLAIDGTAVGILDPQHELSDPAAWIREGAADYLGAKLGELKIKPRRFEEVLEWRGTKSKDQVEPVSSGASPAAPAAAAPRTATAPHTQTHPDFPREVLPLPRLIPSPSQWSRIRAGSEYSFVMMYVGLELELSVSTDSRAGMLQSSLKDFRATLKEELAPFNGKLWFWKDTAGLVLFPFDGESGDAVLAAMRVVLSRLFWQAEGRTNYVTKHFRLAIDVGNTVYSDGSQRETLVSDMVNYMFHLGGKHAQDGQFVLSEEMLSRCPEGLRPYFVPSGSFGGKKIWRMRDILVPHST